MARHNGNRTSAGSRRLPLVDGGSYDAIVIGSGIAGSLAARPLIDAGLSVLMLERGDWVPLDQRSAARDGTYDLTPFHATDQAYTVLDHRRPREVQSCACVGGQAVFFGGAVLRYREADFEPDPAIHVDSGAEWPFAYRDLEPHYSRTESLLDVAGPDVGEPTAPARSQPYPQRSAPLTPVSRMIARAGSDLGLTPSLLPLAINHRRGPSTCTQCRTCDSYACGIGAKNDPAVRILPDLLRRGLELRPNTVAVRFEQRGGSIRQLVGFDRTIGQWVVWRARVFVLAAGTLATPHLLLASGLDRLNPGSRTVGRYLMRHVNAVVFGVFSRPVEGLEQFHKQLCFFDYYFGHPTVSDPAGKLGVIQQVHSPPPGLLRAMIPQPLGGLAAAVAASHLTGFVVIAEDQPRADNRLTLDHRTIDRYGLPRGVVVHRYSDRDVAARRALVRAARRILRRAGASACVVRPIETFSHAVGTVRMGSDPVTSALDEAGRFRGTDNLFVVDGSALPTSAGVNPALTIGANALRIGAHIAAELTPGVISEQRFHEAHLARVSGMRVGNTHPQ